MSMHQGLDLSRFKKVSSDKKTTTLRHAKGHEIRIAHSGLTPKMKEKLDSLPCHEEGIKQYADGTPDQPVSPDDSAPVVPDQTSPAPVDNSIPPKPDVMPTAGTIDVIGQRKPRAADIAQEMTTHDLNFQQDLAMGKIKPETYQDLYDKKDTLGKISTLFGLMLSGAGSGLSGQPNAVMAMMDKQLQNDFEGQKASNTNAQNWYQLSLAHQKQQYEAQRSAVQNELDKAIIAKNPYEIARLTAEKKNIDADTALKASTHAINMAKLGAVQVAQNGVDKYAQGPTKDAHQAALNGLSQTVQSDIAKNNLETGAQIEARNNALPQPQPQQPDNGVDMQKLNALIGLGKAQGNIDIKTGKAMDASEAAQATKEAGQVTKNRGLYKAWRDSFNELSQDIAADKFNPQKRAALVNVLSTQIAQSTAHRYSPNEASAQANAMFPEATDYGGSRDVKLRKGAEFFKNEESETPTLDRWPGIKTEFPMPPSSEPKLKEGQEGVSRSGKPTIVRNGKVVYK